MSNKNDNTNKRIYVREKAHKRYKAYAATRGISMLEALDVLLDEVEAGKQKQMTSGTFQQ